MSVSQACVQVDTVQVVPPYAVGDFVTRFDRKAFPALMANVEAGVE